MILCRLHPGEIEAGTYLCVFSGERPDQMVVTFSRKLTDALDRIDDVYLRTVDAYFGGSKGLPDEPHVASGGSITSDRGDDDDPPRVCHDGLKIAFPPADQPMPFRLLGGGALRAEQDGDENEASFLQVLPLASYRRELHAMADS